MKKIILTLVFLLFILLFACSSDNTNEKVNTENINLKSQIQNLDIKNNELNQKIESIKIQKDNLDIKNNELNQKIESLNKEIESLNKESESKIKETNDLKNQLDEIINGAERTFANLQIAYDKNDYNLVKELYGNMEKNHFTSSLYPEAKIIYEKIIKQEQLKVAEEKAKAEKIKQEQLKALNKLVKKHDDVQGIDFYHSGYVYPHYINTNKISLYIGSKSNTNALRIKISYTGDSWLFFEKVYLSYDGYTLEIKFEEYEDKHTDVLTGGNGVAEWIDVRVLSSYSLEYLRRFANSPNAKMRLAGKSFSKDRILGKFEKLGIIEVLDGLQALEKY